MVMTDVWYYSTSSVWSNVNSVNEQAVFARLFDSDNVGDIEEVKESAGDGSTPNPTPSPVDDPGTDPDATDSPDAPTTTDIIVSQVDGASLGSAMSGFLFVILCSIFVIN